MGKKVEFYSQGTSQSLHSVFSSCPACSVPAWRWDRSWTFFSFSPYHNISLCLHIVCMQPLQPKEKSVCHDIPSVWRTRQSLGKVSHFPVFPAYCWFSITLLLDAPEKTTRTSLLVGFHHFCLKMKLTKMKNSCIKKKSSKQISKQIQTFKN